MGSTTSSLKASSRSLFGYPLLDVVNAGRFEDEWKFGEQNSVYIGEFKIMNSGLHNFVIFTGYEVGNFFLDRYMLAQKLMMDYAASRLNVTTLNDTREKLPMSFAFDLVIDPAQEVTVLRYMAPRVYNYKEIEEMQDTEEMDLYLYTMNELKATIYSSYRDMGNYNVIKSDCRVFARKVLDVLKRQQPTSFPQRDLRLATKSNLEQYTDPEKLLGTFKPTEKLLVAKIFEVVELLWGDITRKMAEFCVFNCLQGHIEKPLFVENIFVILSKDTKEDTMLFLRMVSGWFEKKSHMQASVLWNVSNDNPRVFIRSVTSSFAPDGQLVVDLALKSDSERDKKESYPVMPYKK